MAVGDALGVPVEFKKRGTFHVISMQGYGTHHQPPGTWSDDTSLTLALADNLFADGDRPDLECIAWGFTEWYDKAAYTPHGKVFDVGNATAAAIKRLKKGVAPEKAGGADERDNGNGSLMRVAPLAFYMFGIRDAEERFRIVRDVSSLTHAHEWSVAACYIYVELLNKLRMGRKKKAAYAELREDFARGVPFISKATLAKFVRILENDISLLPEEEIRSSGFVIDTLEAALWCFLTTDNYKDAVLKAVNLGEDTDTTGAVTGALAGLAYGLGSIPREWLDQLAGREEIQRIAIRMPRWDYFRKTIS
ncbi:MAG TPA: ADP-ribosylglycohydrolase family protein [Candidatus Desulfovibrio gallistercoris]|nr:ADP-ribosylglycohydrolase family protein [Candidatus Desulfovibrio gallistercoris]